MNTYRFTSAARGARGRVALSMLGGLALLLCLLLPSPAYAAATRWTARATALSLSPIGVLEQAGVSVVRLAITYTTRQKAQVTCTALGTLIASWPAASSTDQNNWVVTDGALLAPQGGTCSKGSSLTQIQLLANHLYTNTPSGTSSPLAVLATLRCSTGACQDQQGSSSQAVPETLTKTPVGGGVLFSFHTGGLDMQPSLDAGTANPSSGAGIELANQNQPTPWPTVPQIVPAQIQTFLTPINPSTAPASASGATPGSTPVPGASPTKFEPGMPFVDTQGRFLGMQVSGTNTPFSVTNLKGLEQQAGVTQQAHGPNLLKQQWEAGIQAFDQGNYVLAQQELEVITQEPTKVDNPNFQAAQFFAQQAATKARGGPGATSTPATGPGGQNIAGASSSFLGIPISLILLIGLVAGVIFLILLLVLVSLVFGRRRASRRSKQEELERFKEDEAAARRSAPIEARRIAEESQRNNHGPAQPQDGAFSEPLAQAGPPVPPVPPASVPAIVPQAQPEQQSWQPEQPQPDYEASELLDTPTVPILGRNGRNNSDALAAGGHVVRELRNVSLAVGSISNVGLRRQHKPNEDSFFAFQAAKSHNAQPMQFGLFIIADGMGGHANGQDASRTAIQTMIDFMLPKIAVDDGAMDDQGYLKMLEEGVQHANYAVHQRNIEDRADMGTTMTTALVIGSMAYIANVGDSRTYIYRQSTGLTKITRDHSVVASLVDAGIIQPDDIYTHPKRNQIYRNLGEKPVVEVDSYSVELQPGDKLLLCTDGLWDMVRDPEIQRIIAAPEPDPTRTSEELIQAALKGGGEDNVSVIVVSISEAAGHTGLTGIQFLSKPDTVTVPDLPAM